MWKTCHTWKSEMVLELNRISGMHNIEVWCIYIKFSKTSTTIRLGKQCSLKVHFSRKLLNLTTLHLSKEIKARIWSITVCETIGCPFYNYLANQSNLTNEIRITPRNNKIWSTVHPRKGTMSNQQVHTLQHSVVKEHLKHGAYWNTLPGHESSLITTFISLCLMPKMRGASYL